MEQISEQREIENPFTGISPRNYFYLANGQIIKNIKELPNVLENINEDIFSNHVTPYKNDFAKWVYDVYKKDKLSRLLGEIKSKEELARVIRAYIKQQDSSMKFSQAVTKATNENRQKEDTSKKEDIPMRNSQEQVMVQPSPSDSLNNANTSNFSNQQNITAKTQSVPSLKINEPKESMSTRKIYVWKTADSMDIVLKPKVKPDIQKDDKKEEIKKEEIKKEEILTKQEIKVSEKITSADEFFEKNPVLMAQAIDAKKKKMEIEHIEPINFDEHKSQKEIIDLFKDHYSKSYQRMSLMRKAGFDTSLIEMMLARIPAKIKLYEASDENKDAVVAKRYINEAIEELNNLKH